MGPCPRPTKGPRVAARRRMELVFLLLPQPPIPQGPPGPNPDPSPDQPPNPGDPGPEQPEPRMPEDPLHDPRIPLKDEPKRGI